MTDQETLQVERLIKLFDGTFKETYQTILVRGPQEPLYLPQSPDHPWSQVVFAHGFFASALHEIAHWCLAGSERRKQLDYGYWYQPTRSPQEQEAFYQVEIKPQALEWVFSLAAGRRFFLSADNLQPGGAEPVAAWYEFRSRVRIQTHTYLTGPLPDRAETFASNLFKEFYPGSEKAEVSQWRSKALDDYNRWDD